MISIVVLLSFLSTLTAGSPLVALYGSLRLLLSILTAGVVISQLSLLNSQKIVLSLNLGAIIESLLSISQFIFQKTFNLALIGERLFDANTTGVAKINLFGHLWLRSYGSFPHPNVLAAFLVLVILINLRLLLIKLRFRNIFTSGLLLCTLTVEFLALGLTFSRSALIALGAGTLLGYGLAFNQRNKKILAVTSVLVLLSYTLLFLTWGSNPESFTLRTSLNQIGLELVRQHFWYGVGVLNFIPYVATYPSYSQLFMFNYQTSFLQPIHNFWLLVAVELGLGAVLALGYLIFLGLKISLKNKNVLELLLLTSLVVLSLTDHYFWTLVQGQLMFWLVVFYSVRSKREAVK